MRLGLQETERIEAWIDMPEDGENRSMLLVSSVY